MTARFFDAAYEGTPPWDIGRPQKAFVGLVEAGRLKEGPVLDVGCGTGENALFLAANGFDVLGIDASLKALEKARRKAHDRHLKASFALHDALRLAELDRTFAAVLDCGMFHTLEDDERVAYAEQLAKVLRPGGTYFLLAFSDKEPKDRGGPRRVSRREIRDTFLPPFRVLSIEDARFESLSHPDGGARAYLAVVHRG